jgi:hypothetical protein
MPDTQSPAEPTTAEAVENQPGENQSAESEKGGPEYGPEYSAEYGGPKGREPTRYGDWEKNGRCIDF